MFHKLRIFINDFFQKGHSRSVKAKKEVLHSYIYRLTDIGLGFLLVRIVLDYLDSEMYGIWLILFSFTMWFNFMDVGLELGLRNKLTESLAKSEYLDAKLYVSTTYALLALISSLFFLIFLLINHFLNWSLILNTSEVLEDDLSVIALFVFGSFAATFTLKIITTILLSSQQPSIIYLRNLIEKILKLIIITVLLMTTESSLLKLGVLFSLVPVIVLSFMTMFYFFYSLKYLRPKFRYIKLSCLSETLNLGWKFFVIQIAVIVLFATDNIIITQLFGPENVTIYEISKKYFSVPIIIFFVLVQPLWSAVTDSYIKEDYVWIQRNVNKLVKIWGGMVCLTLLMLFVSSFVYDIWLGEKISIPFTLSACWAVFVSINMLSTVYTNVINGMGKITISLINAIFNIIINIPLSILLARNFGMGVNGVLVATIVSLTITCCLRKIQFDLLISKRAKGLWAK